MPGAGRHPASPPRKLRARRAWLSTTPFNHAFVAAFDDTFRYMVVAAVIGAAMGLTLRRLRATATQGDEQERGASVPAGVRAAGNMYGG